MCWLSGQYLKITAYYDKAINASSASCGKRDDSEDSFSKLLTYPVFRRLAPFYVKFARFPVDLARFA